MSEHLSSALARRDFACAERFQRTLPVVVTTASATYARVLEACHAPTLQRKRER